MYRQLAEKAEDAVINENSSSWQTSVKRSPTTSRIVLQAGKWHELISHSARRTHDVYSAAGPRGRGVRATVLYWPRCSVERVLRSHSKPLPHLIGNRRPPADRRIRPRHRKQVANPTNLPQVLHHFAEWKHLGSEVIDVIQDVPREVCGERVDILAALGERDWVKLKEDRWGLGAGQQVGCATQDSRFAAFRVDLDKTWPTPDECTERIERNCVRPRQPMVRTSV
jgi:hypothetical protein